MSSNNYILEDRRYKEQIAKLGSKGLKILSEDRMKALEYAKKGIEEVEPENLTVDYLELVADGLQVFARQILADRAKTKPTVSN